MPHDHTAGGGRCFDRRMLSAVRPSGRLQVVTVVLQRIEERNQLRIACEHRTRCVDVRHCSVAVFDCRISAVESRRNRVVELKCVDIRREPVGHAVDCSRVCHLTGHACSAVGEGKRHIAAIYVRRVRERHHEHYADLA